MSSENVIRLSRQDVVDGDLARLAAVDHHGDVLA
jgi:hypothetical protein